ncbi:GH1 family beta-glucosidase [Cellulomonas sp. McL0617]|uniref:GH1 family beta-glucosidase n=1 Tax=Cellulomonas sp. McL0617 TaxID=3415675 RepID=UPI003CF9559E
MTHPIDRRTVLLGGGAVVLASALAACAPARPPEPTPSGPTPSGPTFPRGFTWGVATSAFQVEGSTTVDGRGPSIWDTFAAEPGHIDGGATGDPAADHYRRWSSDLDLLVTLGIPAYRFSVAWPRIQPTGSGATNQRGIDFYRRLVDGLLDRGIHPAITLYHWDLPQPLQDAGGWAARDTAQRFADYAGIVVDALHDVDATWLTINEPKTTAYVGYAGTEHAPGLGDPDAGVAAVHHQLLAHGLATQAFRASGAVGRIGLALNLLPVYPVGASTKPATRVDAVENRMFLDPVLLGSYPDDAIGDLNGQLHVDAARFADLVQDGDLATISTPCDVLGVNYYGVAMIDERGDYVNAYPTSAAGWQQIHAAGLYDLLTRLRDDYPNLPVVHITENGIPDDETHPGLEDDARIEFLRSHLEQAARAIEAGVDLRGYYAWSFLDNFEWARGLRQRWGLVNVDFTTQARTPKSSAHWYSRTIAATG